MISIRWSIHFSPAPLGKLYRPIPMASFALNWYYNGAGVFGYHFVNILIHCINGFLLYLVVLNLLQTPCLSGSYHGSEIHWIASLAAVFWALNPMHVQTVTYIVQRMASMAALFYLVGIYLYLQYRKASSVGSERIFLAASVVCYLTRRVSKENAVLFPISIYVLSQLLFLPFS